MRNVLERLERHLVDQQAPAAALLRPGLSDEAIDELIAPTGLDLPEEARELFRWHDGTRGDIRDQRDRSIAGGWQFHPLQDQVARLHEWRAGVQEAADEEGWELVYKPVYFPLLQGVNWGSLVMIRCGHRTRSFPNPVIYAEQFAPSSELAITHFSLYSLFETWLLWLDAGHVWWDHTKGSWQKDDRLHWTTYRAGFD
jgi:hypothetical protein